MIKTTKIVVLLMMVLITNTVTARSAVDKSPAKELERLMQQHHGKVIYLDFWASWCGPCRKSFPWMNDMQKQYQEKGLVVLSVNLDEEKELATQFLKQTPAKFDIVYDASGDLARKFKLKGMPSSYLFDREGNLVSSHNGFNDKKKKLYEKEIQHLLR
jgi:thiol-disulfide isomerase/thioredoxin